MNAGFAKRCISPTLPAVLEGNNLSAPCESVRDDLYARALWLEQEGRQVAVVALDLLFMDRPEVDYIKSVIWRRFRFEPDQVMLNFSHTHSGPRVSRWSYSGEPSPVYIDALAERIGDAIEEAMADAEPVTMLAGTGATSLPISRRRPNAEGYAEWGPSHSEPVCRLLPVCQFLTASGYVKAVLFSVSCHPTINYLPVLSAEYPGQAVTRLNAHFDTTGCMFLQGAGGDAKPVNIADGERRFRPTDWSDVERAGEIVADEVMQTADILRACGEPELRSELVEIHLPMEPTPDAAALETISRDRAVDAMKRAWAADMLEQLRQNGVLPQTVPVQMHFLQLSRSVRLVGLEGELMADLGTLIAGTFPTGVTFPMGYTNGARLNIPADRQLPQGGYGVDSIWEFHWPAKLALGIDATIQRAVKSSATWEAALAADQEKA